MQIELRELSLSDGDDICDMIQEIGPGENGLHNRGYGMDFRAYIQQSYDSSQGINLPEGYVPDTTYWLYIDGQVVGFTKLRHHLNDKLTQLGGHIGYCIRPSARGKGYGNIILAETLKKAKEKNIDKVLVTCNETNVPSQKIIEHNGGVLENILEHECRYWIQL